MTKKRKKTKKTKKSDSAFQIYCQPDETEEQSLARIMISPTLQSAATINEYANSPEDLDLQAIMTCLEKQVDQVKNGNIDSIEQMLLVQACTMDVIANSLFRRAKVQEYISNAETYMKLGLKSQSQSRANLEALIGMKKPRSELVKQTNIAHGHQQVNNFPEKENPPNELLEKTDGERLDPGTLQGAVSGDSTLETVGEQHRTKNKRRQG